MSLAAQHAQNVDTLLAAQNDISRSPKSPSPISALFNRNKPAKANSKSKLNKKKIKNDVEKTKSSELNVVSAGGVVDDGEHHEAEVLDLADQLLDQIDASTSSAPASSSLDPNSILTRSSRHSTRSGSSHDSNSSNGHGFRQGIKDALSKGKNRQQARKDRKEAEVLKQREQAEQEAREAPDDGAEEERRRLDVICRKQHWQIYEMEPDGHCLFNAIADQLNFWRISSNETYATTRRAAAAFMMEHPDDFLPYLPASEIDPSSPDGVLSPEKYSEYCDSIATTAVWGGQTEINALSRYWKIPIHVIQSDGPEVKVGEEAEGENGKKGKKRAPLRISYHKKMYGLGEHYNSVRPAPEQPAPNLVYFSAAV